MKYIKLNTHKFIFIRTSGIQYPVSGIRLIILIALLINSFAASNKVNAQINFKAYFDSAAILIGDQIHLNLFVDQPIGINVGFPVIKDTITEKIIVVSELKADTSNVGNGRLSILKRYVVTSFDSGVYTVQPLKFTVARGSESDTVLSMPLTLGVFSIPIQDPNKIADIKGIKKEPLTFAEILPYILIGLGILLIAALAAYIIIRLKQKKPIFPVFKPVEPAHVIAFRELEKVKNEKLWQQGQTKQYYTRVTDIIRQYIENRYDVLALESTSEEIINDLKKLDIENKKIISDLQQMLEISDLVKFAKAEPLPDENDNSWKIAYDFILNTMKTPEENIQKEENIENQSVENNK